jgi:methyl acetate hydrolase
MSLARTLDSILSTAADSGDVPGVTAVVVDRDGLAYEGGFGVRALGNGAAMTPDTVVWYASITKPMTSAAVMQQVERGALRLDAPAREVVPELGQVRVLTGFADDGSPQTRAPRTEITLRHLLTHTAGFGYHNWSGDILRYLDATGTPGVLTCRNAALTTPLLFDPGTGWNYGINIDWAAKMLEAVTGQRLGAYLQAELFAPLGIADTGFRITPEMRSRFAPIHQRGLDGRLAIDGLEVPQDPEFEMGGGGLYGTMRDYARFIRMILNRGQGDHGRVLAPETVAAMSSNQMPADHRISALKSFTPDASNDAEFFPGMPKHWGLSFMINTERAPTGRPAGSLAWAGLSNTYFWIDPANGIGGAFATQILPFADIKALPLFLAFETAVYDARG